MESIKLWEPYPKQAFALSRTEFEILYGGARGGGKTDCGIAFPLYNVHHPRFRALVIRKNFDDLKDWIDRSRRMYEPLGAIYKGATTGIHFPSGAIIRTGHLNNDNAFNKYQGHEYQNILIEELTQIARLENYLKLISSCRSTVPELKPQVFSTTNPGGDGHEWVRERFIDVAIPNTPFIDPVSQRSRIYVPAKVEDNPALYLNDPDYVNYLNSLPTNLRKAWRDGSWEDFEIEGALFTNEINELIAQGRYGHYPWNPNYPVQTWWDLGIGLDEFTTVWFTQMIDDKIYIIHYLEFNEKAFDYMAPEVLTKGYYIDRNYPPHDIVKRDVGIAGGRTRKQIAEDYGLVFTDPLPSSSPIDRVSALRELFGKFYFNAETTSFGINRLKAYKREWNDSLGGWDKDPKHDKASHAADSLGYMALYIKNLATVATTTTRTKATENSLLEKLRLSGRARTN